MYLIVRRTLQMVICSNQFINSCDLPSHSLYLMNPKTSWDSERQFISNSYSLCNRDLNQLQNFPSELNPKNPTSWSQDQKRRFRIQVHGPLVCLKIQREDNYRYSKTLIPQETQRLAERVKRGEPTGRRGTGSAAAAAGIRHCRKTLGAQSFASGLLQRIFGQKSRLKSGLMGNNRFIWGVRK